MKIREISINNYKSLQDIKISYLNNLNVVYGLNNSGKSNLFKFLYQLFSKKQVIESTQYDESGLKTRDVISRTDPFFKGFIREPYFFHKNKLDVEVSFKILIDFEQTDTFGDFNEALRLFEISSGILKVELIGKIEQINHSLGSIHLEKILINKKIYLFAGADRFFEETRSGDSEHKSKVIVSILDYLGDSVCFIDSERHFSPEPTLENLSSITKILNSQNFKKWIFEQYVNNDNYPNYTSLLSYLQNFSIGCNIEESNENLKENIKNFPFTKPIFGFSNIDKEFELMFEIEGIRYPLRNFGTGIQQMFYLLVKIYETDSKIILIEELELNLSKEYQQILINNIKEYLKKNGQNKQVFFTTHSPEFTRNDFNRYLTTLNNGSTKFKRITR